MGEGRRFEAMREFARRKFTPLSISFEGCVDFMYLDVKSLVTTGIGNLIDPIDAAMPLDWRKKDGTPATREEIVEEWNRIKQLREYSSFGGGYFENVATLHLSSAGLEKLFSWRLDINERYFRQLFAKYDLWGSDAQLACHLFAWACGPALDDPKTRAIDGIYPKFSAALAASDWREASRECWIGPILKTWNGESKENTLSIVDYRGVVKKFAKGSADTPLRERLKDPRNPGLHPRNIAIVQLFRNAHEVANNPELDPDVLYYPRELVTTEIPSLAVEEISTEVTKPSTPMARGAPPTEAMEEIEKERQLKEPRDG